MAELVRQRKRGLIVIANDTARPGIGVGQLIAARLVRRVVASHIGTNPETQRLMLAGELEVELVPQGTLAERIRSGGHGLGGVLTPTGVGTSVQEGKRTIEIDGRQFLLELPLRADFALVNASRADHVGNLAYSMTARNFNPLIAMAGRTVIAEPREIVPVGVITPERSLHRRCWWIIWWHGSVRMDDKTLIARRVARELRPGTLVNLGIGLPTLVAAFVPRDRGVFFQSENGIVGMQAMQEEGLETDDLTDAGGNLISALPGAATFDSAMSFGLIRGGHLDITVLGGLQVDRKGRLANWDGAGRVDSGHGGHHGPCHGCASRDRRHDAYG